MLDLWWVFCVVIGNTNDFSLHDLGRSAQNSNLGSIIAKLDQGCNMSKSIAPELGLTLGLSRRVYLCKSWLMFCMASVFRTGCSLVWRLDALVVMCPPEVQMCYRAALSSLPEDLLGMRRRRSTDSIPLFQRRRFFRRG